MLVIPEISVINKINKKVSELTVDDIALYCEQSGITISTLCLKLNQLLNATREIKDRDGEVVDTIPDNNIQLKALGVALELLRLVSIKPIHAGMVIEHQIAPGDIERLEAIAHELKGLESRLNTDSIQQGCIDADTVSVPEQ